MAVSNKPWGNISDSDYKDATTFCKYCLIDMNEPGKDKVKNMCKLPVYEPDGTLNRNGVHAAAAALAGSRGGVDAPLDEKRKAARKLLRLYAELKEEPPESIKKLAGTK